MSFVDLSSPSVTWPVLGVAVLLSLAINRWASRTGTVWLVFPATTAGLSFLLRRMSSGLALPILQGLVRNTSFGELWIITSVFFFVLYRLLRGGHGRSKALAKAEGMRDATWESMKQVAKNHGFRFRKPDGEGNDKDSGALIRKRGGFKVVIGSEDSSYAYSSNYDFTVYFPHPLPLLRLVAREGQQFSTNRPKGMEEFTTENDEFNLRFAKRFAEDSLIPKIQASEELQEVLIGFQRKWVGVVGSFEVWDEYAQGSPHSRLHFITHYPFLPGEDRFITDLGELAGVQGSFLEDLDRLSEVLTRTLGEERYYSVSRRKGERNLVLDKVLLDAAEDPEVEPGAFEALLRKGAFFDAQDETGSTPLMLACSTGNEPVVEILLREGASVQHRNRRGMTPLLCAAEGGQASIVRRILEAGSDPSDICEDGKTALMYAAEQYGWLADEGDNEEVLYRLLIDRGVDLEALDSEGKSALDHAQENDRNRGAILIRNAERGRPD